VTTTAVPGETAGLIDLTRLPLRELWPLGGDAVLDHTLRRMLDHSLRKVTAAAEDEAQRAVSAFNSAI
jgi:hypothetical protein